MLEIKKPTGSVPQCVEDFVVITLEGKDLLKDTVTHGSMTLIIDPLYDPEGNKQVEGRVVSIPPRLTKALNIVPEVAVGDRIFFHYNGTREDLTFVHEGATYYKIHYPMIIALLSEDDFMPVCGWSVCEEIIDEDTEQLEGGMGVKKTASGIIYKINERHNLSRARLVKIGSPKLNEDRLEVESGDVILYDKYADFTNVGNGIHGKKYFYIRTEDILMKEL